MAPGDSSRPGNAQSAAPACACAALGLAILAIAAVTVRAKRAELPEVARPNRLAQVFGLHREFHDPATGRTAAWRVHRTPADLVAFGGIGMLAGMFGLGAGWANVPVRNLVLGAPLKVSVATSGLVLAIIDDFRGVGLRAPRRRVTHRDGAIDPRRGARSAPHGRPHP